MSGARREERKGTSSVHPPAELPQQAEKCFNRITTSHGSRSGDIIEKAPRPWQGYVGSQHQSKHRKQTPGGACSLPRRKYMKKRRSFKARRAWPDTAVRLYSGPVVVIKVSQVTSVEQRGVAIFLLLSDMSRLEAGRAPARAGGSQAVAAHPGLLRAARRCARCPRHIAPCRRHDGADDGPTIIARAAHACR